MWCRNVRSQLSAFADGELPPAMTQRVREHLAACDRCAREHASLKRLSTLTGAIPWEEVSPSLHQRILASLQQTSRSPEPVSLRPSRPNVPPLTWAWAAFATAAVAVACGTWSRPGHVPAHRAGLPVADAMPTPPVKPLSAPKPAGNGDYPPRSVARLEPAPPASLADAHLPEETSTTAPVAGLAASTPSDREPASAGNAKPTEKRVATVLPIPVPSVERPQPAPVSPSGKLATDPRVSQPEVVGTSPVTAREGLMAMPGDPLVNNTGTPPPTDPLVMGEKESPTRMAGMAIETESPGEEDEGLRSFRMFLQENSRTVPQPPSSTPGRERRMRKSL